MSPPAIHIGSPALHMGNFAIHTGTFPIGPFRFSVGMAKRTPDIARPAPHTSPPPSHASAESIHQERRAIRQGKNRRCKGLDPLLASRRSLSSAPGVGIEGQTGAETDSHFLAIDTTNPYNDARPLTVPNQPEKRRYRMCYWDGDPSKDRSDIVAVTFGG